MSRFRMPPEGAALLLTDNGVPRYAFDTRVGSLEYGIVYRVLDDGARVRAYGDELIAARDMLIACLSGAR